MDRNSPEDWPDAMLVTADELRRIVIAEADNIVLSAPPVTPEGIKAAFEAGYEEGWDSDGTPLTIGRQKREASAAYLAKLAQETPAPETQEKPWRVLEGCRCPHCVAAVASAPPADQENR